MPTPTPDWHAPLQVAGRTAWAARDVPGVAFVSPATLAADGPDAVSLDLVSQDLGATDGRGVRSFGLLRQRLVATDDEALRLALIEAGFGGVRGLPVTSGLLRMVFADAAGPGGGLDLPLDADGVGGLVAAVQLSGEGAELVLAALRRGAAMVRAHALLRVDGYAARWPGRLELDVATCLATLAGTAEPGAAGLSPATLVHLLRTDPGRLGARLSPDPADDVADLARATAAADRIAARCAVADLDAHGEVTLRPARPGVDVLRLDLAGDVVVPRYLAPATDPWGPLAGLDAAQVEQVVHRHLVPVLDDGRRTVSLTSVITPPWAGAAAIVVEVIAPANPPHRPGTVRRTALLDGAGLVAVELPLAPGEALAAQAQVVVVLDGPGGEQLGPVVPVTDDVVVLHADALPVDLLPVRLDTALAAAAASVTARWEGLVDGVRTVVEADLDQADPSVTLLLPPGATGTRLSAEATHADGRTARTGALPVRGALLDPFAFAGTGRHEVQVGTTFASPDAPALAVELQPDDGPARTILLTPAQPSVTWAYVALSPFATGYRWRLAGEPDLRPGPADTLHVTTTRTAEPAVPTSPVPDGALR